MAVYRPPNIPSGADDLNFGLVKEAASHQEVLIVDDFNAPAIDWDNLTVEAASTSLSSNLMDLKLDHPLAQSVKAQTRFRENQIASCLDLIFTKDVSYIDEMHSNAPVGENDHTTLIWDNLLNSQRLRKTEDQPNI
ncbi:unnamed protein product [Dibothriocephalus latus]|uniref:Endonuclease/exonuclease/phosphatase domain-containing protein n=1 Tax=Dibothriocephalus latus TaxID=60516 RepID=A0A3P7M0R9_DIBLA|nr:unnamed protein product [Dibothriocephalus latus]